MDIPELPGVGAASALWATPGPWGPGPRVTGAPYSILAAARRPSPPPTTSPPQGVASPTIDEDLEDLRSFPGKRTSC